MTNKAVHFPIAVKICAVHKACRPYALLPKTIVIRTNGMGNINFNPCPPKKGSPWSEYQFARTFSMAWFRMNGIEMIEASTANRIAMALGLSRDRPGNGYAKKAIIEWHLKALEASKSPPIVMEDFYGSQRWRKARYAALRLCGGRCTLCGDPPGQYSLHVDHIKPRSQRPDLALDPTNLQVLCRSCNLGKSDTDSIDWRKPRH